MSRHMMRIVQMCDRKAQSRYEIHSRTQVGILMFLRVRLLHWCECQLCQAEGRNKITLSRTDPSILQHHQIVSISTAHRNTMYDGLMRASQQWRRHKIYLKEEVSCFISIRCTNKIIHESLQVFFTRIRCSVIA